MFKNVVIYLLIFAPVIYIFPHALDLEERRIQIACKENLKLGYEVNCQ